MPSRRPTFASDVDKWAHDLVNDAVAGREMAKSAESSSWLDPREIRLSSLYKSLMGVQILVINLAASAYFLAGAGVSSTRGLNSLVAGVLLGLISLRVALDQSRDAGAKSASRPSAVYFECASQLILSVAAFGEVVLSWRARGDGTTSADKTSLSAQLRVVHIMIMFKWAAGQLPASAVFFPEIVRCVIYVLFVAALGKLSGGDVDPVLLVRAAVEGCASALVLPVLIHATHHKGFSERFLSQLLETCPPFLQGFRDRTVAWSGRLVVRYLPEPLVEFSLVPGIFVGVALVQLWEGRGGAGGGALELARLSSGVTLVAASVVLSALLTKLTSGSSASLGALGRKLRLSFPAQSVAMTLHERLAESGSDEETLRIVVEVLHGVVPSAVALVAATFAADPMTGGEPGSGRAAALRRIEATYVDAVDDKMRQLVRNVFKQGSVGQQPESSSVAFVSQLTHKRTGVADSADFPLGVRSFSEWWSLASCSSIVRAMTVPVKVGHVSVGFLELFFDAAGTAAFGGDTDDIYLKVAEVAEVLGDSIILRRVRATHENSLKALESAQNINSDIFPDHVVRALESRQKMRESVLAQKTKRRGATGWQFAVQPGGAKGGKDAGAEGGPAAAGGALAAVAAPGAPASLLAAQRHHGSGPRAVSSTGSEDNSAVSGQSDPAVDLMSDYWPSLTIIFADVVGFTEISNHKDPVSTMSLLNNLFTRFDSLTISHGVYKVETIGDCFMAVSGMFPARSDHARAALRLALDLHHAAAAVMLKDDQPLRIRVGIHSGPVTSGVIGHLRARFTLFGDTVNTASRMESSGLPEHVQMSAETVLLLGIPESLFQAKRHNIKGKGEMTTYMLDAKSPNVPLIKQLLSQDAGPSATAPPQISRIAEESAAGTERGEEEAGPSEGPPSERRSVDAEGASGEGGRAGDGGHAGRGPPRSRGAPPPSLAGGSVAGDRPAGPAPSAEPAITVGEETLKEKSLDHLAMQLLLSVAASAGYVVLSGGVDAHWDLVAHKEKLPRDFRRLLNLGSLGLGGAFCLAVGAFLLRRRLPENLQKNRYVWAWLIVFMHGLTVHVFSAVAFFEWVLVPRLNCASEGESVQQCSRGYFAYLFSTTAMLMYYTAQFPVAVMLVPELSRCAMYVATNLWLVRTVDPESPSREFTLELLAQAALAWVLGPIGLAICTDTGSASYVFQELQTCPSFMLPFAAWLENLGHRVRQELFADKPLLDGNSAMVVVAGYTVVCAEMLLGHETLSISAACQQLLKVVMVALVGSAAAKLRPTSTAALDDMAQRLGLASQQQVMNDMRARLSVATSEQAVVAIASDALRFFFPNACGVALATFAEGSGTDCVALINVFGHDDVSIKALADSLPSDVGSGKGQGKDAQTSVWFVCYQARQRVTMADSRDFKRGVHAFTDWSAAVSAGLRSSKAVTAPLTAGPVVVGFITLHFELFKSKEARTGLANLRELCDAVGGAIFVRRAFAINRDTPVEPLGAAPADGPEGDGASQGAGTTASVKRSSVMLAESDEDRRLLAQLDAELPAARARLLDWNLDAWALEEAEVKRLMLHLLHSFGLLRRFSLRPVNAVAFVDLVASHMLPNPFHSFRHAFTVAHTAWLFVAQPDGQLRRHLEDLDILALILSAVCHDLEHPGTTNAYQVNTGSELALRYNDVHVLENHHCMVAFQLIEQTQILANLTLGDRRQVRKMVVDAILNTDMAVHQELLGRVEKRLAEAEATPWSRESVDDRMLLVSFTVHCADLCNPLLPPSMSRRIAESLGVEFDRQAAREREQGLQVTVMLANNELKKADMEIGFIAFVVRPLYLTLVKIAPDLESCLHRIDACTKMWQDMKAAAQAAGGGTGVAGTAR